MLFTEILYLARLLNAKKIQIENFNFSFKHEKLFSSLLALLQASKAHFSTKLFLPKNFSPSKATTQHSKVFCHFFLICNCFLKSNYLSLVGQARILRWAVSKTVDERISKQEKTFFSFPCGLFARFFLFCRKHQQILLNLPLLGAFLSLNEKQTAELWFIKRASLRLQPPLPIIIIAKVPARDTQKQVARNINNSVPAQNKKKGDSQKNPQ